MSELFLYKYFYYLIVLSLVRGNHFFGGRISWQAVQPNTTNFSSIQIKLRQVYSWYNSLNDCGYSSISGRYLHALNGTTSYETHISASGKCISYDLDIPFITAESIETLIYSWNSTMILFYNSSTWSQSLLSNSKIRIATFINLKTRNDSERINSSPITSMPSVITIPVNTQQVIRIPMIDIDRDIVKCRWAINNSTYYYTPKVEECGGICQNLPNAQLITSSNLDNNCTLIVNISTVGYYAIAIQIEDFMPSAPYYPLSSIPLQFVIRGINDSCYSPAIIGQIDNDATIVVFPNTPFSTSIIAKTGCNQTKITKFSSDMLPLGVTSTSSVIRQNVSIYSMIFTWTPTVDQIGTKQLYCTIAIDDNNKQSTQYCLNFVVTEKIGE